MDIKLTHEGSPGKSKRNRMHRNPELENSLASVPKGSPRKGLGPSEGGAERHEMKLERKARVSWAKAW